MFKDSWLLFLAKGGGCNPVSWIKSWNEQDERPGKVQCWFKEVHLCLCLKGCKSLCKSTSSAQKACYWYTTFWQPKSSPFLIKAKSDYITGAEKTTQLNSHKDEGLLVILRSSSWWKLTRYKIMQSISSPHPPLQSTHLLMVWSGQTVILVNYAGVYRCPYRQLQDEIN